MEKHKLKAFLKGFRSAFDLTGSTFELPSLNDGLEADARAIRGDWQRVGDDLRKAMNQVFPYVK
ncbi:hypothetical protein FACS1894200_08020 [Spirochaetia bacterium]|nr:hypothetical protein FACS1894200_08020 [Spirochaetia bacterium]